jgi:signal transduction histidine kinase/CheY-like chemotaxis protein
MSRLKEELVSQREKLESYLDAVSGIGIVLIGQEMNILDCNHGFTRIFQLQQKPVGAPLTDFLILGDNDFKHAEELKLPSSHQSGVNGILYCHTTKTESGHLLFCERLMLTESRAIEQIGIINNELINLQRESVKKNLLLEKLRKELDERIAELENTIVLRKLAEAEKEKLEAQNRQLQKSESLSRMAAAIAHHFNNQLAVVIGNLEMAIDEQPKGVAPSNSLTSAMQAAWRSADMSRLMLTYLGQSRDKVEPLDISSSCRKILPILKAAMPANVILETDFPSPCPVINTSPDYMQQILTNLITNAWESVGDDRGTISLNVKTVSPAEIPTAHRFPVDFQLPDNPCACLEVTDTGCGIAARDIEQIFDPFYSTKFTGRGMGMAVVLGLVKTHKGVITVNSKPGSGSTFRIFFPLSEDALPQSQTAENDRDITISSPSPGKMEEGGTVLLVEDEEPLRKMIVIMLDRLGFSVLEAKDGIEALDVFWQHREKIRFVLTDLTMPRMDGWETLTALRKLQPDIPVILASGYDLAHVMAGVHPELPQAFLAKPYNLKALRAAIAQTLERRLKT